MGSAPIFHFAKKCNFRQKRTDKEPKKSYIHQLSIRLSIVSSIVESSRAQSAGHLRIRVPPEEGRSLHQPVSLHKGRLAVATTADDPRTEKPIHTSGRRKLHHLHLGRSKQYRTGQHSVQ